VKVGNYFILTDKKMLNDKKNYTKRTGIILLYEVSNNLNKWKLPRISILVGTFGVGFRLLLYNTHGEGG
jgi:hypothetical protein